MNSPKEFLNAHSMLTPGLAGTLTMATTNTLAATFQLPHPWPAVVAMGLSFLCGLLVLAAGTMPHWKRAVYYVLNSFVIFNVAVGSNSLGVSLGTQPPEEIAIERRAPRAALLDSIVPAARAQPSADAAQRGWCCRDGAVSGDSRDACQRTGGSFHSERGQAQQQCSARGGAARPGDPGFFRPWLQKR